MTVYVDPLEDWGWVLRGRKVHSCHMFTDTVELDALHTLARRIGMKATWFQDKPRAPHYDLTPARRAAAIAAGAVVVDRHAAVAIWRERREAVAELAAHQAKLADMARDVSLMWRHGAVLPARADEAAE